MQTDALRALFVDRLEEFFTSPTAMVHMDDDDVVAVIDAARAGRRVAPARWILGEFHGACDDLRIPRDERAVSDYFVEADRAES